MLIVYLHKISDNRMNGSLLKNLKAFSSMCGKLATPNVVIGTTMWKNVKGDEGSRREQQLKDNYWAGGIQAGYKVKRLEESETSAWNLVGDLNYNLSVSDAFSEEP